MKNINKKKNWNEIYLTNMKYQSMKRKNYCIATLDKEKDELYIIAYDHDIKEGFIPNVNFIYNKVKDSETKISEAINDFYIQNYIYDSDKIIYKGWSILDSLISLRQNLSYSYDIDEFSTLSNKDLIELEKSLSIKDKNKIIKWCKIYGMPFLGYKYDLTNKAFIGEPPFIYGFKNDLYACILNNVCIARLSTFLIGLNILFKTFCFCISYYSSSGNFKKLQNFCLEKYLSNISNFEYDEEYFKFYIKKAFGSISNKSVMNLNKIIDNKEPSKIELYSETLLSLAMFQLSIVASFKKIYNISECKCCKNLFIPTRTTRTYCLKCSRQKNYKKEHGLIK